MKKLPWYSSCCQSPILGDEKGQRMYCHKCGKTIRSFSGGRRAKVMAEITYERSRCHVRAMLLGEVIANAHAVPNLVYGSGRKYRKVGRSSYKFHVGGAMASAIGLPRWKVVDGFKTLKSAEAAMRRVLV